MFANLPKFVQETIRSYLASDNFPAAKDLYNYCIKESELKIKHFPHTHKSGNRVHQ